MVKGIYPYVSPSEGMSEDMIIQAWFKRTVLLKVLIVMSLILSELTSFDVNLNGQSLSFNFAPYSPENAVTDEKCY